MLTVTLSWVPAQDWALLTATFKSVGSRAALPCEPLELHLGSVAAIFPAAIPQGTQGSHTLWRSQQTVDRKKQDD